MIKKTLVIVLTFFNLVTAQAQFSQDVGAAQSQLPQASLQGESQKNYNVDLFTGIANVTIPIYNHTVDGLDLSVSLNYSCKGIQVDQIASSCGLGWSVGANSYITRDVNDMEDEITLNSDATHQQYRGVWVDSENTFWNPSPNSVYEHEYDKFHAVIAGRAFDFVMKRLDVYNPSLGYSVSQYVAYTFPKSNIQVQLLLDGNVTSGLDTLVGKTENSHIISFNITDESGNFFEFERGDYEWKNCYDPATGNVRFIYYPTTKWVLKRLTTATGAVVNYSYNRFNVSYPFYAMESLSEYSDLITDHWYFLDYSSGPVFWGGIGTHISSIQYPNGDSVIFNFGALSGTTRLDVGNSDILSSITVKSGYDANVKNSLTYMFGYTYFNTPIPGCSYTIFQTNEVSYEGGSNYFSGLEAAGLSADDAMTHLTYGLRLKLNGITKVGSDGLTNEPYYTFNYNSRPLPLRLSPSQDYYGYYNGDTIKGFFSGATWVYPGTPYSGIYFGAGYPASWLGIDKTPDTAYMKADLLTSVTNSMGGKTQLFFGPHNLSDPTVNTHTIPSDMNPGTYDGLRIDSITYSDGYSADNNTSTSYNFTNGYRLNPGGYNWYISYYDSERSHPYGRIISNKLINPIDFFHNSNHGYSNVAVTQKGYNGEILSYTQYEYSNIVNNASTVNFLDDDKTQWYMHSFPPTSFQTYQLGLLQYMIQYSSPSGYPLSQTSYTYDTSIGTQPPSSIKYFFYTQNDGSHAKKSFTRTYQPFYNAKMRIKSTSTTKWSGSDAYITTANYTYDANDFITSIQTTDSRGRSIKKNISYNTSYDAHNYPSLTANLLPGQHFAQDQITEEVDDITDAAHPKVLSFKQKIPNYSSGKYLIDSIASATIDTPTLVSVFHNLDTNNFYYNKYVQDILRFTKRDNQNNILETWKSNVYNSSIWDTRIGKKIADVSNAQYRDIAFTSFEGPFAALGVSDYNKGNWDFDPTHIQLTAGGANALTGRYYYDLLPSPTNNTVTSVNTLVSGRKYVITFWATAAPTVKLGSTSVSMQSQFTAGIWTLYFTIVNGNGNKLSIQSSGVAQKIDEVRMYPFDASMKSYTYEPLFGINSYCDETNNIVYNFYDTYGRVKMVKDINGNILSYKTQVNQGTDY